MTDVLIAIDPGIKALGVAFFEIAEYPVEEDTPTLLHCEVVTPERGLGKAEPVVRVESMQRRIDEIVEEEEWNPVRVAIEFAELRGSAVGHAAAVKGDMQMLCMAAGFHLCAFREAVLSPDMLLITVNEWKGQLKKSMTDKRIKRLLGNEAANGAPIESHASDAVGIGLHALGIPMDSPRLAAK